jgi:hypothetical protein
VVWKIPPGTRYINSGSTVVDNAGRVHVLARNETGAPVHFQRDPKTGNWSRQNSPASGRMVGGEGDRLFIISEENLHQTQASDFGKMKLLAHAPAELFRDCSPAVDPRRTDNWVSVIGQTGKKVSVVDFWIGDRQPSPASSK